MSWLLKVLEIGKEIADEETQIRAYSALGGLEGSRGNIPQAIAYNEEIAKLLSDETPLKVKRTAYSGLAITYFRLRQFPKAIEYAKQGIAAAQELNDIRAQENLYDILAQAYRGNQQYKDAFEALAMSRAMGDSIFLENRQKLLFQWV